MQAKTPTVETSQSITDNGSVPLAQEKPVKIEAAPKGRQKFLGQGAMIRNKGFVVR
jgi:hypothetical protein